MSRCEGDEGLKNEVHDDDLNKLQSGDLIQNKALDAAMSSKTVITHVN